ncbi:tryptophan-rich sensory protein [Cyanobium sp. Morenito 9A2]|uniref:tryptophan-rich sensory protein n=1 Tax=Cyanobium sp. Morenito 9A2 TaxID=2823718 RepID=UPI0020CF895A|nr:tryptophan-rich sensory protein [Cyanobium sp. Morenito 9A2]MCP9848334.1 tryptophan-rich sensory protein [Cyanobium sp. Morenito 9A2]
MSAWIVILLALIVIYLVIHPNHAGYDWYLGLNRPNWFNIESKVPTIWLGLYVCFFFSARLVLETKGSWALAFSYLTLVALAQGVSWLTCTSRSLHAGTVLGALAWIWAVITLLTVAPLSGLAALLLLPYLIWGAVATVGLQSMRSLNPGLRRPR